MRPNVFLVAVSSIALWIQPSHGQPPEPPIHFAQITDVHLFDTQGKQDRDSRPDNEQALNWAIREINRRNKDGPAYDFVVFTGDFGLEDVKPTGGTMAAAVSEFQSFLDRCDVKRWLLVPGNNDLENENPVNITVFHDFVAQLKATVRNKTIEDFAPGGANPGKAMADFGRCFFFGLDNASFKNNFFPPPLPTSPPAPPTVPEQHLKDLTARIRAVTDDAREHGRNAHIYVFCHIPDIDDPYLVTFPSDKAELKARLDSDPKEKDKFEAKLNSPKYPTSAWTVTQEVRDEWNAIISKDAVKRIFAGHFHSDRRWQYYDQEWARGRTSKASPYAAESFNKLLVCPPIAVKLQINSKPRAQGFRDVLVDRTSGNVASQIVWYDDRGGQTASTPRKAAGIVLVVWTGSAVMLVLHFRSFKQKSPSGRDTAAAIGAINAICVGVALVLLRFL